MKEHIIEKQFTRFVKLTVEGIRKDYYKKQIKTNHLPLESWVEFKDGTVSSLDLSSIESDDLFFALRTLTDRQIQIITLLLEGYTETEVSRMFGISQQGVNSAKLAAYSKIRKYMEGSNNV